MENRVPWITLGLVATALAAHVLHPSGPAAVSTDLTPLGLAAYPLTHFDTGHLALNLLPIAAAGAYIEHRHGPRRLLAIVAGVHAVSIPAVALLLHASTTPTAYAGASTITYALAGYAALDALRHGGLRAHISLAVLAGITIPAVLGVLTHGIAPGGGITATTHLYGLAAGLLAAAPTTLPASGPKATPTEA